MIGTPVEDAQIRLQCWQLGVEMAGNQRHNATNVAILSTAAYNFVAGGDKLSPPDSRDKSTKTPKR